MYSTAGQSRPGGYCLGCSACPLPGVFRTSAPLPSFSRAVRPSDVMPSRREVVASEGVGLKIPDMSVGQTPRAVWT